MKRIVAALCLCAGLLLAELPSTVAIRNAKIVTVSGPVLNRGTVVLRNGLIEAVGDNVAIPADAWVVEGEGLTVYPGLIDGLSTVGLDVAPAAAAAGRAGAAIPAVGTPAAPRARGPEDRPATTSWLRAADTVRANDRRVESMRSNGFTSAAVFPNRGIFAGQGAMIALGGEKTGQMVIAAPLGQYATMQTAGFGGGFPSAMFGTIAYIRQMYLDLDHYQKAKAMYAENPKGMPRPVYDRALEGLAESPRLLLPARLDREFGRMLNFAAELKQPAVLYGGHEAYKAVDVLKRFKAPVLVSLKWPERSRDGDPDEYQDLEQLELREKAPTSPAALAKAGVKFAFYTDGQERLRDFNRAVRRAMESGLSMDDAVRAVTLSPAEIFGVADRVGSIEKGKIANLVVTKGDLFQDRTTIQMVFVDGVKYLPVPEPETPGFPGAARPTGAPTAPNSEIIEEVRQ
jgi:hypothetical protein